MHWKYPSDKLLVHKAKQMSLENSLTFRTWMGHFMQNSLGHFKFSSNGERVDIVGDSSFTVSGEKCSIVEIEFDIWRSSIQSFYNCLDQVDYYFPCKGT